MKIMKTKTSTSKVSCVVSLNGESWIYFEDIYSTLFDESGCGETPFFEEHQSVIKILSFYKQHKDKIIDYFENEKIDKHYIDNSSIKPVLPFEPLSYRDFMLFEEHAIEAKRGFVKKYMPHMLTIINIYERIANKPFPKLKPEKRWYEYPIYYLGNHLNFVSHQSEIKIPAYTQELDYELELGVVLSEPLYNATVKEAEDAIGGFVVFNDFSARDVQASEMQTGFGPMKSKNFANSISNIVVTADEILPKIDSLKVEVKINDQSVMQSDTRNMHYSLANAIAYASWEEHLYPGEFFGTGTIPGCTGIENGQMLNVGDTIHLEIKGIGTLENTVV